MTNNSSDNNETKGDNSPINKDIIKSVIVQNSEDIEIYYNSEIEEEPDIQIDIEKGINYFLEENHSISVYRVL